MTKIRDFLSKKKSDYLHYRRSKYFPEMQSLLVGSPSIISNNCFAGRIYQDLEVSYTSPTAGLYMFYPDYIDFLSNLKANLNGNLKFVKESKYELGNQRLKNHKHVYPIALLNDSIEINFLHYSSEKEAADKWYRRCERVDLNNLLIFGAEMDLCTPKDIEAFDKLPFAKKFFFTCKQYDIPCTIFMEEFKNSPAVGDPYEKGHVLYKAIVKRLNETS